MSISDDQEKGLNVFDADLDEVSAEYLAEMTDMFVIQLLTALFGTEELKRLDEADQARFVACQVCQRFLEMMYARSTRVVERKSIVDYLNSLI